MSRGYCICRFRPSTTSPAVVRSPHAGLGGHGGSSDPGSRSCCARDPARERACSSWDDLGRLRPPAPSAWSVCLGFGAWSGWRRDGQDGRCRTSWSTRGGRRGRQERAVRPCQRQPRRGDLDGHKSDAIMRTSPDGISAYERQNRGEPGRRLSAVRISWLHPIRGAAPGARPKWPAAAKRKRRERLPLSDVSSYTDDYEHV
jgi:hypothetical protein